MAERLRPYNAALWLDDLRELRRPPRPKDEHEQLWPFGLTVSEAEVKQWIEAKALPEKPDEYRPEVFAAEVAACAFLMKRCGWSTSDIFAARFHIGGAVEGNDDPLSKLDAFFSGSGIEGREERYVGVYQWLMTVVKFLLWLPPNGCAEIVAVPAEDGKFVYAGKPSEDDSVCDAEGNRRHPREFEPPTAEMIG